MQKSNLYTVLSPKLLNEYDINNSVVVIIDVFRATSTIATALYNGASKVVPVDDVAKCIAIGSATPNSITAGERDGKVIEGLQYGNSPTDYPRSFIENKTLVLTTTNGTKLLHKALNEGAHTVITGSFVNLTAVCNFLLQQNKTVYLGCSGWKDRFNIEDTLFAGAVVEHVQQHFTIHCDASMMALEMYQQHKHHLKQYIRSLTHWHRLAQYGLEEDMEYCVSVDVANVLPLYKDGALYI